jgi:hypothetical protein
VNSWVGLPVRDGQDRLVAIRNAIAVNTLPMRSLVVLVALMVAAPRAEAGEFTPRAPKEPVVGTQNAPVAKAKAKPKAKPVSRRTWQAKAQQPKKAKKKRTGVEKRPMP